ncbi:MAG: protein-methionine-sulfoxide reductase heme-binding subunit MsrQ [Gemmatimonadaceae bacterium]
MAVAPSGALGVDRPARDSSGPDSLTAGEERAGAGRAKRRAKGRFSKEPRWLYPVVFVAALSPWIYVVAAIASDFFQGTRLLGSNPIKEAEHFTGQMTMRMLLLSLSISPAVKTFRRGWLIKYRRTFGLFAFFYVCTHLSIYAALDVELNWADMVADVSKRLYITLGMAGFVLLIPLAVTSTKGWIRRLGSARWHWLHRAVFGTVVLGMIHYYMAVKKDITDPLLFTALFGFLFAWRILEAALRRKAQRAR